MDLNEKMKYEAKNPARSWKLLKKASNKVTDAEAKLKKAIEKQVEKCLMNQHITQQSPGTSQKKRNIRWHGQIPHQYTIRQSKQFQNQRQQSQHNPHTHINVYKAQQAVCTPETLKQLLEKFHTTNQFSRKKGNTPNTTFLFSSNIISKSTQISYHPNEQNGLHYLYEYPSYCPFQRITLQSRI